MDKLAGLSAFLSTAETRSFVAAGRQLGVSASAVGKSIARLEQRLGVRLFQRSTRSIRLTEEGTSFYERCRHVVSDIAEAEALLSQTTETPRGRLRISVITIAHRWLVPLLAEFMQRHPEIKLEIDFDDRIADLIDDGFDAVIRTGDLPDSRLMARRLSEFQTGLFASPDYLRRRGTPVHPRDLARHVCLRFRNHFSGKLQKWYLRIDPDEGEPQLPAGLICNNADALLAAARNGLGIAYMPAFLAEESVIAGTLTPVLAPYVTTQGQFWLLWPTSRQMTPRLRVFVDYLCHHPLTEGPPRLSPSQARTSIGDPGPGLETSVRAGTRATGTRRG